jgi:hypothetical protein
VGDEGRLKRGKQGEIGRVGDAGGRLEARGLGREEGRLGDGENFGEWETAEGVRFTRLWRARG